MTQKEYGDRVEFRIKTRTDIDELLGFLTKYAAWVKVDGDVSLHVPVEGSPTKLRFRVSDSNVVHEDGPLSILRGNAETLAEGPLVTWCTTAASTLAAGTTIDATLEATKLQDANQGRFLVFTEDGFAALPKAARTVIERQGLARLAILTPLVAKQTAGVAAVVAPLTTNPPTADTTQAGFVVPFLGKPVIDKALASIQLDALFAGSAEKSLPRWDVDCKTAVALAEWVRAAPLRMSIARTLLGPSPVVTDSDVNHLLQQAKQDEDDLLHERVTELRKARELFRSEALELIGDVQKLRAEIGALMGADLFHNLVAIGVAISGLELADAPQPLTRGIALGVAILFLLAGIVKAEVNRREFKRVVEFAQKVATMPASASVPDFRTWFEDFHNKAIVEFHMLYLGGTLAAALPALTVASYWAWEENIGGKSWLVATVLAIGCVAYALAFILRAPWKPLKIKNPA